MPISGSTLPEAHLAVTLYLTYNVNMQVKAVNRYPTAREMVLLISLLVALIISDGMITQSLISSGLAREVNPFLVNLVSERNFMPIKVAGGLTCALILWDLYKKRPRLALISGLGSILVYTGIVLWNSLGFLVVQI